jgi:GWxTD domain-containing protein
MKKYSTYLLLFILFPSSLFAQSDFNVMYDYTLTCQDESSGYIEIYYSLRPMDLELAIVGEDSSVSGVLSVRVSEKESKTIVVNRAWEFDQGISKRAGGEGINDLVGLFRFDLPKGAYTCDLMGKDNNDSLNQFIKTFDFEIKTMNSDRFTLSGLQLASSIVKSSEASDSPFYKNHYEVVPNPSLIFGGQLPVIFLYCELYGLNVGAKSKTLQLDYLLFDNSNKELIKKTKYIPSSIPSMVFVKPVNIRKIPSGRHRMILAVSDTMRKISEQVEKNLYIYNPHIVDTSDTGVNALVVASEYFSMSESEVDDMFNRCRYIASDKEINGWESLTTYHDKQIFLYHFWKARDMTPDTPINEFKEEYMQRTVIATELYGTMNRDGWSTDRGRVYCLYGKPSDIEHFPSDIEAIPYEIWHYDHIENRVMFVFADLYGFSDMYLIHSTKQGELSDPNWRRKVQTF